MRALLFISALIVNGILSATAFAQDTVATGAGSGSHTNYATETTSTQTYVAWIVGIVLLAIVFYAFYQGNKKARIIGRKSSRKDREHLNP